MIPQIENRDSSDPTYLMMDGSMLFTRPKEWKELKLARLFKGQVLNSCILLNINKL